MKTTIDASVMTAMMAELVSLIRDGAGMPDDLRARLDTFDDPTMVCTVESDGAHYVATPTKNLLELVAAFREWRGVRPN